MTGDGSCYFSDRHEIRGVFRDNAKLCFFREKPEFNGARRTRSVLTVRSNVIAVRKRYMSRPFEGRGQQRIGTLWGLFPKTVEIVEIYSYTVKMSYIYIEIYNIPDLIAGGAL